LAMCTAAGALCAAGAVAQPLLPEPKPDPVVEPGAGPVPFPHPVITEIFFHGLPRAMGGDANLDGQRSVTGDEFVELVNPHDQPIELGGYQILDGQPNPEWRLTWTFPQMTLAPGERVVVFNGFRQDEIPGADGTTDRAPRMKNPHFGDAWVFSMRVLEPWRAFTNEADFVLLRAPDGVDIDVIAWGANPERAMEPPTDAMRFARVMPEPVGSYQRIDPFGPIMLHKDIDGRTYSPGEIPAPSPENAAGNPAEDGAQGG
ncbi:MAG: lamin tail domain-containing protein, partial [Phycisphaerales bacterium]